MHWSWQKKDRGNGGAKWNSKTLDWLVKHTVIIHTKDKNQILLRRLEVSDYTKLIDYLDWLSFETKNRFGPHPYDEKTLIDLFGNPSGHSGYLAIDLQTSDIVAYSIIKQGILEHDRHRLRSYQLNLNDATYCTWAPSVADLWQGKGIGTALFHFILKDLIRSTIKSVVLWGGVQKKNHTAVNYYLSNNFRILGEFDHYGINYDMILEIS